MLSWQIATLREVLGSNRATRRTDATDQDGNALEYWSTAYADAQKISSLLSRYCAVDQRRQ